MGDLQVLLGARAVRKCVLEHVFQYRLQIGHSQLWI